VSEEQVGAASRPEASVDEIRKRLLELMETQLWAHHVADLSTGELSSTVLERPLTPRSRAERLSPLSDFSGPRPFGGPSYQLSPRMPYQSSPQAYVIAGSLNGYDAYSDSIDWAFPRDVPGPFLPGGLEATFAVSPDEQSLISIDLSAAAYRGEVGHVRVVVGASPSTIEVPISDSFASQTIDLVFFPLGGRETDVFVQFKPGLDLLSFSSISFGPLPLVIGPAR
jgi:hypothetical protein